ncbi:unnamed protein product [Lactuca virosa]|uniref:Uncharacterized protein n=1 Tax=Lactuca virosa TaxID=75947 RepID=A0AAU9NT46_9ASTR|nr:unnamed protein product [Lactuca virosa]
MAHQTTNSPTPCSTHNVTQTLLWRCEPKLPPVEPCPITFPTSSVSLVEEVDVSTTRYGGHFALIHVLSPSSRPPQNYRRFQNIKRAPTTAVEHLTIS